MDNAEATAPTPNPTEQTESQKYWQEYLQKCCEVGQLQFQLHQLDSQRVEIEKKIEVTERAVRSAADKQRKAVQDEQAKLKLAAQPVSS